MGQNPQVVVVGGGATGTAVARDLAMRGLDVSLFERDGLASGASGRMHGLLHSGARYADTDPESARACIQENEVLRRIAGQFVTDTGGLFVSHPDDPRGYVSEKAQACEECSIPVERIDGERARERESGLSEEVSEALVVPDAAVDPCGLVAATALSAERHGATVETGIEVTGVRRSNGSVDGVSLAGDGVESEVRADYVVNAAGAAAGRVARSADAEASLRQSQGALAVIDTAVVDTVVNRCRPRTEGDIAVPHGGTTVLGATDVEIDGPDDVVESEAELEVLVDELAAVVPALETTTIVDSYWGVRPLFDDGASSTGEATRGFGILDHDLRGFSTVVGGKFTTHRAIAEQVTDHVCRALGIDGDCRTDETPLPGTDGDEIPADVFDRYNLESPMRSLA